MEDIEQPQAPTEISVYNTDTENIDNNDLSSISGYLYKKTREGRWQKRWFETNGVYLTYYKSKKMEKLLAALSLPQVGEIKILSTEEDAEQLTGLFTLELNSRIYTLRCKSSAEAIVWVRVLNKLKSEGIEALKDPQETNVISSPIVPQGDSLHSAKSMFAMEFGRADWIKTGKSYCYCC